jgi:leucyl-tRNA synthetase
MAEPYDPRAIEHKWQRVWADEGTWEISNDPGDKSAQYVLEMLPYPSGEPHIGHLKTYSGYDAFGLPAENHAIKTGRPPRESTDEAIASFQREFRDWGISIDWTREFGTHEPEYYRWTQWIFLRMFERGLAYRKEAAVNWCPKDQTVLANEQVIDGRCERCGTIVEVRQLEQWFFKITDYADRLLDDLETVEWPAHVKTMQRNWIGRSHGAEVVFRCESADAEYKVFTTRPDTLFGATFFVMAPEHPDVLRLADTPEVHDYVNRSLRETAEERGDEAREKTGVPLGRTITNPATGEEIPMFVADYVLMEYGSGAIMAVPAHDQRDFDFATKFDLPIRRVIDCGDELPCTGDGPMVNSGRFDGKPNREAYDEIVDWLESEARGRRTINYKLRDWLLSRQRYWGCPIPIVHCPEHGLVPVPDDQLPVELPHIDDYTPKGRSPLAAAEDWVNTTCPTCGGLAKRETDTMDTFVDSSWYFLRYCDAHNDTAAFDRDVVDMWMPVDQYIGGVEHAILHLMYARFFTKALADMGYVGFQEPFANLFTQGMITRDGAKMSKSRGNVVSPSEIVGRYGADTARCYINYLGPPDQDADWSDEGAGGISRFLSRLWRIADEAPAGSAQPSGEPTAVLRKAHWAIDKVTNDMGRWAFNTAIAAVIELVNDLYRFRDELSASDEGLSQMRFAIATAASLLFPFAPHLGAEVYERMTGRRVWDEPWPVADPQLLRADTVQVAVQVNGKLRDVVTAAAGSDKDELERLARESEKVKQYVGNGSVAKTIVVPDKLVNFVLA